MKRIFPILTLCLLLAPLSSLKADEGKTATVRKGAGTVLYALQGNIVPRKAAELKLDFKAYKGKLEIKEPLKADVFEVEKGQPLMTLDLTEYNEALEEAGRNVDIARQNLKAADMKLRMFLDTGELTRRSKRLALDDAKKNLSNYEKIFMPLDAEDSELGVTGVRNQLKDAQDELEQLVKMYKESDLAVDTQEIVIQRAKNRIQRIEFSLKEALARHKLFMDEEQPKRLREFKMAVESAELGIGHFEQNFDLEKKERENSLDNSERALEKTEKSFNELRKDGELFEIKAPAEGILLPGSVAANFGGSAQSLTFFLNGYSAGDKLQPGSVLFTIYKPEDCVVSLKVDEAQRPFLAPGQTCKLRLPEVPNADLEGKISSISVAGVSDMKGKGYWMSVDIKQKNPDIRFGQTVNLQAAVTVNDGFWVDSKAVVWKNGAWRCKLENGREVELMIGARDEKETQIIDGLNPGDKIQLP